MMQKTKTIALALLVAITSTGISTTVGLMTKHVLAASTSFVPCPSCPQNGEGHELGEHTSSPVSFDNAASSTIHVHNANGGK